MLLLQLVGIVLRIVHQESDRPQTGASFTKCIATDADYNGNTMAKVSSVLEGKLAAEYDTIRQFKDLVQHVSEDFIQVNHGTKICQNRCPTVHEL